MKKPDLLYFESARYSKKSLDRLANIFDVEKCSDVVNEIKMKIVRAEVVMASLAVKLTKDILMLAENLKLIATNTTGTDHIDMQSLDPKIRVISLKGNKEIDAITATAELTWGLVLACIRSIPHYSKSVKEGQWNRYLAPGYMLFGKTMGLIGLGRLGTMVANYAKAFGMKVIYYDPFVKNESFIKSDTIKDLLSQSDVVSIHVHLNKDTYHLLDKSVLPYFKNGSVLINTSRGDIIHEEMILEGLKSKVFSSVGLDVLSQETNASFKEENALLSYAKQAPNVIITPHIGGACFDAWGITEDIIIKQLESIYGK